ncbi:MAG: 2-oxoacid:ferredoxin oxidoreductase subunit beta [Planctomycetota bacterium]|nr:MAG: 2-oxoacid:ferredoxin oxidoreductase subunit beta [Planctomycetota bacterium]
MTTTTSPVSYKKKDFESGQEVRWCPGCGDYAILSGVQQVFASLGVPKEKFVVVSGIGCSSRFPYYVDTYGFHGIHGRAPAIASGVKCANPELDVWVATGDGDALSIGGNHIVHAARRNVDMVVLLFNNRIYGLTKGQYSPTSEPGKKTVSTPFGSLDQPFNPINLMLGAGATFVARTVDTQIPHLKKVLAAAHAHRGFSFVEILQNCVIFNNGAFEHITSREIRDDRQVDLRPGQPLVFGKELDKGLRFQPTSIEIVSPEEATVWNPSGRSGASAYRISMGDERGELPVPIGIFRDVEAPCIDREIHAQIEAARARLGEGTLHDLFHSGDTWQVGAAD